MPPLRHLTRMYYILGLPKVNNNLIIARLSKLLHSSSTKDAVAFEHAKNHLNSAATFLDKYTKEKLALANIHCNDVYDLLLIAFDNIDSWLAKYASNDLFCKRLNCRDLLMKELS